MAWLEHFHECIWCQLRTSKTKYWCSPEKKLSVFSFPYCFTSKGDDERGGGGGVVSDGVCGGDGWR